MLTDEVLLGSFFVGGGGGNVEGDGQSPALEVVVLLVGLDASDGVASVLVGGELNAGHVPAQMLQKCNERRVVSRTLPQTA